MTTVVYCTIVITTIYYTIVVEQVDELVHVFTVSVLLPLIDGSLKDCSRSLRSRLDRLLLVML